MFISIEQIKAARALLGWTQKELAEAAGLNLEHVANYESGRSRALSTLEAIHQALVAQGVIFIDDTGVNKTRPGVRELRGQEGFCTLFDDIYSVAKAGKDPDICISNVKEELFIQWHGDQASSHRERMARLKDVSVRTLLRAGDTNQAASSYASYRWVDIESFADVSLYMYGDKTAFIEFRHDDVVITLTNSPAITNAMRKMFETAWRTAKVSSK